MTFQAIIRGNFTKYPTRAKLWQDLISRFLWCKSKFSCQFWKQFTLWAVCATFLNLYQKNLRCTTWYKRICCKIGLKAVKPEISTSTFHTLQFTHTHTIDYSKLQQQFRPHHSLSMIPFPFLALLILEPWTAYGTSINILLLIFWGVVCHLGVQTPCWVTQAWFSMEREKEKPCLGRRECPTTLR